MVDEKRFARLERRVTELETQLSEVTRFTLAMSEQVDWDRNAWAVVVEPDPSGEAWQASIAPIAQAEAMKRANPMLKVLGPLSAALAGEICAHREDEIEERGGHA